MKFKLLLLSFLLSATVGWGQVTIVSDGLNNSSTLFNAAGGVYYTGNSVAGDRPATSPFAVEGTHAYGVTNGTATLTSNGNIDASAYTSVFMTMRLASFSLGSTGNGADGTDIVTVEVSPDAGVTWYSTERVLGNSNAYWAYSTGTGSASTPYDGNVTPVDFTPAAGGNRTADGYSTLTITNLPNVATLRFRITLLNNAAAERWVVDDFKVQGTLAGSTLSTTALTAFGSQCNGGVYGPNSFTITGSMLSNVNVDVAALAGYTYSTSAGGTYTSSLSLAQPGGAYSQTIYVKFNPIAAVSYNGNIVVSGGGASSINVVASGTGVAPVTPGVTIAAVPTGAICAGTSVTFTATPSNLGGGTASYQWKVNGSNVGTGTTYASTTFVNGDVVTCVLTVTGGCVTSATATSVGTTMTVNATPATPSGTISAVQNCGNTSLTYSAPSASLYWQTSATGTDQTFATTAPYSVSSNGTYYVRAFNGTCWSSGTVSQAVTVVNAVAISVQPANQSTTVGNTATFNVTATNAASYQWQVSTNGGSTWTNVGTNSNSYTTPATTLAMSGYQYQVIVTGNAPCGTVTSSVATLTVTTGPCFSEDFASASSGDSISTTNQATVWSGNANFPIVASAYQAGGAIKLGTGSLSGSITSSALASVSGNVTVVVSVKGWTTVEGGIIITLNGVSQTVPYTAVMSGTFENISANFTGVPAGSVLKIETTAKRAFIDKVEAFCTVVSGPEINVTGNAITILDGDTTPIFGDNTNFGTTTLSTNIVKTFTIQNLGTTDLTLSLPITLTDVSAPQEFVITQPAVATIPSGGSTTFTITFNSAVAGLFTNTVNINSNDTDEALYNFDIMASATAATGTGTVFNPGELIFVGYDGQVLGSGAEDEYLVATLVDILPGTKFSIVNSRYEAGAAANVRTDKWGGGGDFAEEQPYEAKITYNGLAVIPAGSVMRFETDGTGNWFGQVDVTTGTTTTIRTSDFSGTVLNGVLNSPNISTSGSDQLYLLQGDFVSDGAIDVGQANYYLNGTLLHGLTNRAAWVQLTSACNGGSTGGNTRQSRLPSALTCFNVESANTSSISGFYENDKQHGLATIRQIVNAVADVANNWTLGTGRYTIDATSSLTTRAGKTFLIGPSNAAGQWVGNVDTNWFNCANWEGLSVPKLTTDVTVDASAVNFASVDYTAAFSNDYGGLAVCNNLTIKGSKVEVAGNSNNKLEVYGNLVIDAPSGALDMDDSNAGTADGQLYLHGNWTNNMGNVAFQEGNGTVLFNGTAPQIINAVTPIGTEMFYNVILNNNFDTAVSNDLIATGNLTVNGGRTLTIDANGYAQANKQLSHNGNIVIENNGQLIQIDETDTNSGTYAGTAFQVKRTVSNLRSLDYVYWSAPVAGYDISGINGSLRYYWNTTAANPNGTQGYWLAASGAMTKGQGYIVRGPSSFTTPQTLNVSFTGKPFNGQFTYPITRGTDVVSMNDNLILVGNPYPSAINADTFIAVNPNIEGAVHIWTHGTLPSSAITSPFYENFVANYTMNDYITYNGTATTIPMVFDGKIASGQGFFIKMNEAGAVNQNITFSNAMRGSSATAILNNTQFFRDANGGSVTEKNRIWLDLINASNQVSTTVVGYVTGATMAKDNYYDAYAKLNSGLSFYSTIDNEAIHIQGRALPFDVEDRVALGMEIPSVGNHKIAIRYADGLFSGNQEIYLEDKQLNIIHDLRANPYSFTVDNTGFVNNRFVLRFKNTTLGNDTFETTAAAVTIYTNESINVTSSLERIKEVLVYDVLGRQITSKKNVSANTAVLTNVRPTQSALIVKVTLENGQTVTKKVIY
jgi:hypothetical protein